MVSDRLLHELRASIRELVAGERRSTQDRQIDHGSWMSVDEEVVHMGEPSSRDKNRTNIP